MKGLYIHIPFCSSICSYCDFPKMVAKESTKHEYLAYVLKELEAYKSDLFSIRSVYIGGGTPNSLSDADLEELFKALQPYFEESKENTIEINSELFSKHQAELFKAYGIIRVSFGVHTLQPKLISAIQRKHTKSLVFQAIKWLLEVGITNINIDMMYGLPGQTLQDVKKDVEEVLALPIAHISYYSLILEEKTILHYQLKHNQISIPDDDLVADMAIYITQALEKNQFKQYEISNYARIGSESIHNLGYWNCEEYIGVGASACGYLHSRRYKNQSILSRYYIEPKEEEEVISLEEAKKEFMMLGLRKLAGVSISTYYEKFKTYPEEDFELDKLFHLGLLEKEKDIIRIKRDKILLANLVFEEFVG